MDAKEFLNDNDFNVDFDEHGVYIAENIVVKYMEEYAKHYHQSKVNNGVLDDVMVCEDCNNIGEESKKLGRVLCDNCFDIAISKL